MPGTAFYFMALVVCVAPASSGAITFSDATFDNPDWTASVVDQDGPPVGTWESKSLTDLVASDFGNITGVGPTEPDFSITATALELGFSAQTAPQVVLNPQPAVELTTGLSQFNQSLKLRLMPGLSALRH